MANRRAKRRNKETTYEFVAAKKQKAVDFLNRIGKGAAADKLEDESVESYGLRNGLVITNPKRMKQPPPQIEAKRRVSGTKSRSRPEPNNSSRKGNNGGRAKYRYQIVSDAGDLSIHSSKKKAQADANKIRRAGHTNVRIVPISVGSIGEYISRYKNKSRRRTSKASLAARAKARKRNPGEDYMRKASKLYKDFHGEDPSEITEIVQEVKQTEDYAELGKLVCVELKNGYKIQFGDEDADPEEDDDLPILASDPDGNQLFVFGGDQDLGALVDKLGLDDSKDLLDLGEIKKIDYFTRKHFHGFKPVTYTHTLGEDTGKRPRLMWDQSAEQMHIVGGEYTIRPEGIVN